MPAPPRIPGLVTCKFEDGYDLQKEDIFIKKWIGYSVTVCNSRAKIYRLYDRDVIQSSALEACSLSFRYLEKFTDPYSEKFVKAVVVQRSQRALYHQCIYFGFIADKKRRFFPKGWVRYEDYFKYEYYNGVDFSDFDLSFLMGTDIFTDTEKLFIHLFISGYDIKEISEITKYGERWIRSCFQKIFGRLQNQNEISFIPKEKRSMNGPISLRRCKEKRETKR